MGNYKREDKKNWLFTDDSGRQTIVPDQEVTKLRYNVSLLHDLAAKGEKEAIFHEQSACIGDLYGSTPLHYAAIAGHEAILDHPQSAIVKDAEGMTPLDNFETLLLWANELTPWMILRIRFCRKKASGIPSQGLKTA